MLPCMVAGQHHHSKAMQHWHFSFSISSSQSFGSQHIHFTSQHNQSQFPSSHQQSSGICITPSGSKQSNHFQHQGQHHLQGTGITTHTVLPKLYYKLSRSILWSQELKQLKVFIAYKYPIRCNYNY